MIPKPTASLIPELLRHSIAIAVFALFSGAVASAQDVNKLNWKESGIREFQGQTLGFRPKNLLLEAKAPEGFKQAPAGLNNPFYGIIEMGPPNSPAKILVLADIYHGVPQRFYIDLNGNGDFTDDPPCLSTNHPFTKDNGKTGVTWSAEGRVTFPFGTGSRTGKLVFFYYQPLQSAEDGTARMAVSYYTDYGLVGEVKIDGQPLTAVLMDAGAVGCFRVSQEPLLNPLLSLFSTNSKARPIQASVYRPFKLNDKWWAVTNLTLDGNFQVVASSEPPPREKQKPTVDLSPGKNAPVFTGKLLNGKTVKFPDDYKGKIVLVDFWATWCAPCVAEIPNVVKAYGKYHEQGFEVLGVSLDEEDWETKLANFTKKKDMTWPQVYEGLYWGSAVAKLYGITAIPRMLLVDGDTGVILADTRGERIAPDIEKALAGKKK